MYLHTLLLMKLGRQALIQKLHVFLGTPFHGQFLGPNLLIKFLKLNRLIQKIKYVQSTYVIVQLVPS
jgi:hypothetical protein